MWVRSPLRVVRSRVPCTQSELSEGSEKGSSSPASPARRMHPRSRRGSPDSTARVKMAFGHLCGSPTRGSGLRGRGVLGVGQGSFRLSGALARPELCRLGRWPDRRVLQPACCSWYRSSRTPAPRARTRLGRPLRRWPRPCGRHLPGRRKVSRETFEAKGLTSTTRRGRMRSLNFAHSRRR